MTLAARKVLTAMVVAIAAWSILPAAAQADLPGHQRQARVRERAQRLPRRQRPLHDGQRRHRPDAHHEPQPGRAAPVVVAERHQDRLRAQHRPALRHLDRERRRHERDPADHQCRERHPAGMVSGTGTKIVFASDRAGTPGIYDLFVDGLERREPGQHHEHPRDQRGLPGLVARRDRDRVLARRRHLQVFAERHQPQAADQRYERTEFEPDWSPSSDKIVYRTGINVDDEIWKMNANGTGHVNLTNNGPHRRGAARVVARRRQDRVHPRRVQGRRGLHDESGRHRADSHHDQHADRRQPRLAADPAASRRYVRPKTATSVRVSLVPAFRPCKIPEPHARAAARRSPRATRRSRTRGT